MNFLSLPPCLNKLSLQSVKLTPFGKGACVAPNTRAEYVCFVSGIVLLVEHNEWLHIENDRRVFGKGIASELWKCSIWWLRKEIEEFLP